MDHKAIRRFQRFISLGVDVTAMAGRDCPCFSLSLGELSQSVLRFLSHCPQVGREYSFIVTNLWYLQTAYFDNKHPWTGLVAVISLFLILWLLIMPIFSPWPWSTESFCPLILQSCSERKVHWWLSVVCWRIFPLVLFLLFYFCCTRGSKKMNVSVKDLTVCYDSHQSTKPCSHK